MNLEYECHITVEDMPERHKTWESLGRCFGWKTSFIVGDPLLPNQTGYFYFTCHDNDVVEIHAKMKRMSNILSDVDHLYTIEPEMKLPPAKVVREKIELIIYDTKKKLI